MISKMIIGILGERGIKCQYIYGRLKPFVSRPLIWIGGKFLKKKNTSYLAYLSDKRRLMKKHSILSKIYKNILLLDYSLQLIFKVTIPYMLGKNIICDRYIYDTIINDIAIDMELPISETNNLIRRFLKIAPEPAIAFLIDLPEEIAFQRKSDIPSIEYLRERKNLYLSIGSEFNMIILNGAENPENIKETVLEILIKADLIQ